MLAEHQLVFRWGATPSILHDLDRRHTGTRSRSHTEDPWRDAKAIGEGGGVNKLRELSL